MIQNLTLLLLFQLLGEVVSRALHLPLPGPVLGMAFLLLALVTVPKLAERMRPTASGLLQHLSLLFVPAGVGIVGHLPLLGDSGGPILLVLVISTVAAIAAGAGAFVAVTRLTGGTPDA